MSIAVVTTDFSPSPKKRLKLAISYDEIRSRLLFTLSELTSQERSKGHVSVTKGEVYVTRERLKKRAEDWRLEIAHYQKQFIDTCNNLANDLLSRVGGVNANTREFLEYASTHPQCAENITKASSELAERIGQSIVSLSGDMLQDFLPKENTEFARLFIDELDTPTLNARGSKDPNSWWDIPLVQVRVEHDLLCVPWWLARTYDRTSLWCGRYALAVSPSLNDTEPPAMLMEKGGGVHILSITRPTFDLQKWMPISQDTLRNALGLVSDGVLSWRLLDGILGDENLASEKLSLFNEATPNPSAFKGVDKDSVRNAALQKQNPPNVVVYQGHWFNEIKETGETAPFVGLHDRRFESKPENLSLLSTGIMPVPLLAVTPEDRKHKILIMNACDSAAPINHGRLIQQYIESRSVFIGANYPLLADHSGPSLDALIKSILKNRYLAHAISEVNTLQTDLSNSNVNVLEVFKKAGLCLFGDVRTSLRKEFDETANDNRARLKMKLTEKWARELDRLGLHTYESMTFITSPDDKPPNWDFSLLGPGPELALVPLVKAIDLCEDDDYVILGPAFSSAESVALVSQKFKNWNEFDTHFANCIQDQHKLKVGILAKRLTSTYMVQLFLRQRMERIYKSVIGASISGKELWDRFVNPRVAGVTAKLADRSFIKGVDISLVLDQPEATLRTLGTPLAVDVETEIAGLLELKDKLPRGILITKREYLETKNEREEILNFCHDFNTRIEELSKTSVNSEDGKPDTFALLTADRARPEHLISIQKFAQTDFFKNSNFDWENFWCRPRTSITKLETSVIVEGLKTLKWSDRAFNALKRSDADTTAVGAFVKKTETIIESQESWQPDVLESVLLKEVVQLPVPEVIKDELIKQVTDQLGELKLTQCPDDK